MSGDAAKGRANSRIERIRRTYPKLSQNSLHLRPKLFKGIQVRAVRRQIKGLRSGITKQLTYRLDMVSPEVVHYHNIAWPQGKTYWACGLGKMRAPSIGPPYSTD